MSSPEDAGNGTPASDKSNLSDLARSQSTLRPIDPGWGVIVFTLTYLVMIAHEIEHVAQMYQKWVMKVQCPFECRGLMGDVFDIEWVHWAYNFSTFVVLIVAWLGMRLWRQQSRKGHEVAWWSLLIGIFVVQGYHVIEHSAKIGQWLINGHQSPTPGLLGLALGPPTPTSFSLIEMHATINTIVFVLVTIGFVGYRIWTLVPESLHLETSRAGQTALLIVLAILFTAGAFFATNKLLHGPSHQAPKKKPAAQVVNSELAVVNQAKQGRFVVEARLVNDRL